jgi:putative transposase
MSLAENHRRQKPALGVLILHRERTIVFVTVCTAKKQPWLACEAAHSLLVQWWTNATAWLVGSYVLMPDHLHFFAMPGDDRFTIEQWLQYWKSHFSKSHNNQGWNWQSKAFHHRLRNEEDPARFLRYMRENPVRAGLVKKWEDWQYAGKVHAACV